MHPTFVSHLGLDKATEVAEAAPTLILSTSCRKVRVTSCLQLQRLSYEIMRLQAHAITFLELQSSGTTLAG